MVVGCIEFLKLSKKTFPFKYTEKEIWVLINDHITKNNVEIINIETIFSNQVKVAYNEHSDFNINNSSTSGYRIFYKTK